MVMALPFAKKASLEIVDKLRSWFHPEPNRVVLTNCNKGVSIYGIYIYMYRLRLLVREKCHTNPKGNNIPVRNSFNKTAKPLSNQEQVYQGFATRKDWWVSRAHWKGTCETHGETKRFFGFFGPRKSSQCCSHIGSCPIIGESSKPRMCDSCEFSQMDWVGVFRKEQNLLKIHTTPSFMMFF